MRGIAARRRGEQSARIDRIDRNVGAICGVGGGAQLRAIFFAGLRDAAGEFDQRFSAGDSAENVGEAFDGCEFLVGIEDVEFGFIGREGGAGIFLDVVFAVLPRRRRAGWKDRSNCWRSVARSLCCSTA